MLVSVGMLTDAFIVDPVDLSACNLWYSETTRFIQNINRPWYNRGMRTLNDLLNERGEILSFNEAREKFDIPGTFLDYAGLVNSLPEQWRRQERRKLPLPVIHPMISFLLDKNTRSKTFYNLLLQDKLKNHNHKWVQRWCSIFEDDLEWPDIYTNVINATRCSIYRTLHYKIITRIEVTNILLQKMGIEESNMCRRCQATEETILHKFWGCQAVKQFWDTIHAWLVTIGVRRINEQFTDRQVLFGVRDDSFVSHVIIVAKYVIRKGRNLDLCHVKCILRNDKESEMVAATFENVPGNRDPAVKWKTSSGEEIPLV